MAKKSKVSMLGIISGICVLAGLVLLIMPMCLSIFQQNVSGSDFGIDLGGTLLEYGIFADFGIIYQSTELATAVSAMFVAGLCLAAIYLILYCIDTFTKVKFDCSKIRMFIAFLLLALCVATLVCGLVFVANAVPELASSVAPLVTSVGFWLGVAGMLVASVFGFLGARKK